MNLVSLLGDRYRLSVRDLIVALRTGKAALFICLAIIVMITADSPGLPVHLDVWIVMIVWPFALAIYLAISLSVLTLYSVVEARWPTLVWPLPVSGVLGVIPAAAVCEMAAWHLTSGAPEPDLWGRVILFVPSVIVFETVFYRFVLPTVQNPQDEIPVRDLPEAAPPDTQGDSVRHLLIGSQKVAVSRVRHIEAREHHVKVTLDGATLTQRARLSDIVAQTRPEDGCQPHRSWWVSRNETLRLRRDGNRHVLQLADDTRIPVARTRLATVQSWVEEHVDPQTEATPDRDDA